MRPLPGLLPSSLGVLTCILLGSPAAPTATCTSLTRQQLPDTTIGDAGHPSAARSLKKVARARAGDAQSWSCWTRRPASRSQSCGLELSGQTVIEPFISRASQAARGSWWRQGGHHRAPVPDRYSLLPAAGNEGLRRSLHEQAQHSRADCASNSLEREAMPTERGGAPRITGNLPPQRSGCMRQSQVGLSADVPSHNGDASVAGPRRPFRDRVVARAREPRDHSPVSRRGPRDEGAGTGRSRSPAHDRYSFQTRRSTAHISRSVVTRKAGDRAHNASFCPLAAPHDPSFRGEAC